ncbi:transglycosylase family protein [Streptomyces sp. NRRL WC-3742]|uniref:transglycosylase family protein n=1 Tax=Streptomyces sp. NRRL WC-3742 TaxID=1463934 RepID=UPI00068BC2E3|nr:transglycosylase family protein [Streptomyces sp. NRRL WC-3742]
MRRTNRKNRHVLALTAACAALVASVAGAGSASAASVSTWEKVAQCESSGDWSINTGNGYYGGLQFDLDTWNAYGGQQYAAYPHQATENQQITIAEKVLAVQGPSAWPKCGAVNGLGTDTQSPFPSVTLNYSSTTGGDYNGDKVSDLFAKDSAGDLFVWTGNKGAGFSSKKQLTSGWKFTQTAAADFNGDGKADLVAGDSSGNLCRRLQRRRHSRPRRPGLLRQPLPLDRQRRRRLQRTRQAHRRLELQPDRRG